MSGFTNIMLSSGLSTTPQADFVNVFSLLALDGIDGSTTIIDETGKNNYPVSGQAQIDTSIKKYGTGSAIFDGSDSISSPDSTDFNLGSSDFCIEGDIYFTALPASNVGAYLASQYEANVGKRGWGFGFQNTAGTPVLRAHYSLDGNTVTLVDKAWSPTTDTWYHIAYTRDGANIRLFVDGIQIGSTDTAIGVSTINSPGVHFTLGALGGDGPETNYITGHIDNFRLVKGQPVYTENFTPPQAAHPTS